VLDKKVVFVELRTTEVANNFQLLYKALEEEYGMDVFVYYIRKGDKGETRRCLEMLKGIADAKYVFLHDTYEGIGSVDLREETILTQTWHGCGAFKKFGYSTADTRSGEPRKVQDKYPMHRNYTYVTVSSPEVIWAYEEALRLEDKKGVVTATGISRTDVFYDEAFKKNAAIHLKEVFPKAAGKKIILYAPTFRGWTASAKSPDGLDLKTFSEKFSDEYVLLIKHHFLVKNPPDIEDRYQNFACDCTGTMSIEELLCVSDICISDYSSLIFEYSLFERPMIFFAYDIEEYYDWRGFYYDYDELTPGPVCKTTEEMVEYIQNLDHNFDKQKVIDFKEKFMSACDGHATERIIDLIINNGERKFHK